MPRIQGVDIPPNKQTHISLRYLKGIGPTTALELCEKVGIDPRRRASELSDDEVAKLTTIIDRDYLVEGALRVNAFEQKALFDEVIDINPDRRRRQVQDDSVRSGDKMTGRASRTQISLR